MQISAKMPHLNGRQPEPPSPWFGLWYNSSLSWTTCNVLFWHEFWPRCNLVRKRRCLILVGEHGDLGAGRREGSGNGCTPQQIQVPSTMPAAAAASEQKSIYCGAVHLCRVTGMMQGLAQAWNLMARSLLHI